MRNALRMLWWITLLLFTARAAESEWKFSQEVRTDQGGFVRTALPLDTISEAKPDLGDLRLRDPFGQEAAFLLERPTPAPERWWSVTDFNTVLQERRTIVSGTSPPRESSGRLDQLRLETPAPNFLKAVTVEGSRDGTRWEPLARGRPVFRQSNGPENVDLALPKNYWPRLRITLDDTKSPPIPITGLQIRSIAEESRDRFRIEPAILDVSTVGGRTDVRLRLPAANVWIASVTIEADDPVFMRRVTLLTRRLAKGRMEEQVLGTQTLYRIADDGNGVDEKRQMTMTAQVLGREAVLRVDNGDNRPINITRVSMEAIPVYMIFYGPPNTVYNLLVGNPLASAKTYDVSSLKERLPAAGFHEGSIRALTPNPVFKAAEALPGVSGEGQPLDVSGWGYRKKILRRQSGIQHTELDLETLAHAEKSLDDLRLVREGRQVPFILDATDIISRFAPTAIPIESPEPGKSRWVITLPFPALPITALRCSSKAVLFQRPVQVFEEVPDERGGKFRRRLGTAQWKHALDQPDEPLIVKFFATPQSRQMTLEVEDRDNRPIDLSDFHCEYQSPRLLYKTSFEGDLYLYYGRADAQRPQYDLSLAARELLSAPAAEAPLSTEEALKGRSPFEAWLPTGATKYIFWGAMALVVVVLLGVIAKLLPAEKSGDK